MTQFGAKSPEFLTDSRVGCVRSGALFTAVAATANNQPHQYNVDVLRSVVLPHVTVERHFDKQKLALMLIINSRTSRHEFNVYKP